MRQLCGSDDVKTNQVVGAWKITIIVLTIRDVKIPVDWLLEPKLFGIDLTINYTWNKNRNVCYWHFYYHITK